MITLKLVENYFMIFFIYSFLGWSIETLGELIKSKKFVNRGFLIGPICPVYGVGSCLITALLTRYSDDIFAIFGLSAILCGALEYFTSYIMEKLFKARWWNYSNFKLNINGRICLEVIVLFAAAGIAIIKLFNPLIETYILSNISDKVINVLSVVFGIVLLTDIILSFNIMNKIKNISTGVAKELKDNTEEITIKVKEIILEKSLPYRRILEAFPQAFATRVKNGTKIIVDKAEKAKEAAVDNISNAVDKTKKSINYAADKTKEGISHAVDKTKEGLTNVKEKAINAIKNNKEQ